MFEFMTRRHAQPADAPLEGVRFTREDLFLLMGGVDMLGIAVNKFTFDVAGYVRHRGALWREDMAARLAPLGLVDSSGAPSDELAAAVGPLGSLGVAVADGPCPQAPSDRDRRTASVSIDGDRATALVRADRRGGLRIVPLGERSTWPGKVERIFCLPPVHPAPEPAGYRFSPGMTGGVVAAMRAGDAGRVRAACALMGLPAEPLCSLVPWVGRRGSIQRGSLVFGSVDYRDSSQIGPEPGAEFNAYKADGPLLRTKISFLHPSTGVCFTEAYARKPSGEMDSYGCIDFLPQNFDLLAYMTDFQGLPPEPDEEGTSCSSS